MENTSMNYDYFKSSIEDPNQKKRYISAQKAECTPLSINDLTKTGSFSGSHGNYVTSIYACQCIDFVRRKLPCKHIYRLAMELNIINETFDTSSSKIKKPLPKSGLSLEEIVITLENLSNEAQIFFKDFILEHIFRNQINVAYMNCSELSQLVNIKLLDIVTDYKTLLFSVGKDAIKSRLYQENIDLPKKNMKLDVLIEWCFENEIDIQGLFPDIISVTLPLNLKKNIRRVYTYLKRKFDFESYFDSAEGIEIQRPYGSQMFASVSLTDQLKAKVTTRNVFPDDEITVLLNKYKCNRCNKTKNL